MATGLKDSRQIYFAFFLYSAMVATAPAIFWAPEMYEGKSVWAGCIPQYELITLPYNHSNTIRVFHLRLDGSRREGILAVVNDW